MDTPIDPQTLFIVALLSFPIMALPFWGVAIWRKVQANFAFAYNPRLKWLVAAYPVILIAEYVGQQFHPVPSDPMIVQMLSQWDMWQVILVFVIAAPLAEEYIFRGVLLVWLRRRMGEFLTVLITALAWAALHTQYDLIWMSAIAASGIVLGYIRMRGGSLWLTIGIHMANNAIATLAV